METEQKTSQTHAQANNLHAIPVDVLFRAVDVDLMSGVQVMSAQILADMHSPQVEPTLPLLIGKLEGIELMASLKATLLNTYPSEHPVTLVRSTGTEGEQVWTRHLVICDEGTAIGPMDHLYVPPVKTGGSFVSLLEIVAHLRAPEGCPWDREQTLESLRHDLLDEAAEVLEAIDVEVGGEENTANIVEELGDLLLLPAMMTQIASEEGRFQMSDVTQGIVNKLVRRHPHVFGDVDTDDVDQIVVNWEAIKAQEKAERGEKPRGPLDGVPAGLPALEKARKIQSKAQKAGLLDRQEVAQSIEKQFSAYLAQRNEETLGLLLWSLVALAKEDELNCENALRRIIVEFRSTSPSSVETQGKIA